MANIAAGLEKAVNRTVWIFVSFVAGPAIYQPRICRHPSLNDHRADSDP